MYNLINGFENIQQFRHGGADGMPASEEPTFLTFSVDFVFDPIFIESMGMYNSPLLIGSANATNAPFADASAEVYLASRGLLPEVARLARFKQLLREISTTKPWFFQSISGVDKLWINASNMAEGYKAKEAVLHFTTLESLDLKISYLADLYRKTVYDGIYMRELLPENMRQFQMYLYIGEFRNMSAFNPVTGGTPGQVMLANGKYFASNATFFRFDCYLCEFDFSTSIPNAEFSAFSFDNPAGNSFNVKVGWFMESHQFSFFDIMTKESFAKHFESVDSWKREQKNVLDGVTGASIVVNNSVVNQRNQQ